MLSVSSLAFADGRIRLRVVTEHFPPFQVTSADGVLRGSAVDVVTNLLNPREFKYKIEVLPWARALVMAKSQPNTLIFSIARTPAREGQFHWIMPVGVDRLYFIRLKKRKDVVLNHWQDVKRYSLAMTRGAATTRFLEDRHLGELVEVTQKEQRFHLLNKGRVDLIIGNLERIAAMIRSVGIDPDTFEQLIEFEPVSSQLWLAASLQSDHSTLTILKHGARQIE